MQKIIKLSDTHYIIVDDSEIKEDWVVDTNDANFIFKITDEYINDNRHHDWAKYKFKITHSTQPLEYGIGKSINGMYPPEYLRFDKIKPLSLSEVEEAIYGYSVEKMADDYVKSQPLRNRSLTNDGWNATGFVNGFNAHKELVKNKLFTINDMELLAAELIGRYRLGEIKEVEDVQKIINSRLPKTEWDVEINEQGKIKLI